MDVLAVQASAVPCERVFSSSKETDTKRRSRLSPSKMTELQILKYIFRNERLTFTAHLLCSEEELTVLDIPDDLLHELISEDRLYDLDQYIQTSRTASVTATTTTVVGSSDPATEIPVGLLDVEMAEGYLQEESTDEEDDD